MKILVFSDSHSRHQNIIKALALHPDAKLILHLGDGVDDLLKAMPDTCCSETKCVSGNCDIIPLCKTKPPSLLCFEAENKKILMCHGHEKNVKYTLNNLIYSALEHEADIVLFGHTHQRYCEYIPPDKLPAKRENGLYVFNPGSISFPKDSKPSSYGIIDIRSNGIMLSCGSIQR